MKKFNIIHILTLVLFIIYLMIYSILNNHWTINISTLHFPLLRIRIFLLILLFILLILLVIIILQNFYKKRKIEYIWDKKNFLTLGICILFCIAIPASICSYIFSLEIRKKEFELNEIVTDNEILYKIQDINETTFNDNRLEVNIKIEVENVGDSEILFDCDEWHVYGENEKGENITYKITNITDLRDESLDKISILPKENKCINLYFTAPFEAVNLELLHFETICTIYGLGEIEIPSFSFKINTFN